MEKDILQHPYNIQEINEDTTKSPLVQALLALREEGYSKARDAIEEGLAMIRDKQGKVPIKDAIKVFTKGIISIEDPLNESETLVQLLICRAQANFNLENNLSVIEDLDRALKITKGRRSDAYVMKFKVLMRMKRYDELIAIYKLIKDQFAEDKEFFDVTCAEAIKLKIEAEKKPVIKTVEISEVEKLLQSKKVVKCAPVYDLPQLAEQEIRVSGTQLVFPVVMLYDEFNQFDVVSDIKEDTPISEIIEHILHNGLPWDTNHTYNKDSMELFAECNGIMAHLPKAYKLIEVLTSKTYKMPVVPCFIAVSKASPFFNFWSNDKCIKEIN